MTQSTVIIHLLRKLLQDKEKEIQEWFFETFKKTPPFFYNSVDIRHSGFKIAPVDTNLFPGGFNNLSPKERERAVIHARHFFDTYYPNAHKILLIAEDHTRNLYYFENVAVLHDILTQAGKECKIASFQTSSLGHSQFFESVSGRKLTYEAMIKQDSTVMLKDGFTPDLILINNDLTGGTPELIDNIDQPIIPPPSFGWHQRRKTSHFDTYSELARNFGRQFDLDPWLISTLFSRCGVVDFKEQKGIECVAFNVEKLLHAIREKYAQYDIKETPYVFIKSDRGTYGMGIMTARSADELLHLNKDTRKKMNAIKGGISNTEVIIQEGIPTIDTVDGYPAEPMLYVVGGESTGCFYRTNTKQDAFANLNSSGMKFTSISPQNSDGNFCNSLGFIAKLAGYAAAWECYVDSYQI